MDWEIPSFNMITLLHPIEARISIQTPPLKVKRILCESSDSFLEISKQIIMVPRALCFKMPNTIDNLLKNKAEKQEFWIRCL